MSDQENATESPSSRPMTLRQQARKALRPLDFADIFNLSEEEIQAKKEDAIIDLCQETAREAHQQGQVSLMKYLVANYPTETWLVEILNTVRRAELTQKPPQPPQGAN